MRVERLEVFGFKSFMDRLCLPLEGGITGVVGPNGCGKSNIIDALRWVLGETKASQLRGGVLEDVIFNGTEELRPLGLAEVSLVIRADRDSILDELIAYYEQLEKEGLQEGEDAGEKNEAHTSQTRNGDGIEVSAANCDQLHQSEGAQEVHENRDSATDAARELVGELESPEKSFLSDIKASLSKYSWLQSLSEVQVTRRLYRSGESEFFINKVPCRLKDLKELFRVLGLASRGYTIIAQGEIGRIITAKPDDRRQVIEEAAHIAGFRDHINAVGKRLEDTRNQVVRLDDLIKEVTRQVTNLKRQSTRAMTRAQLKVDLKELERELFCDTFVRLQAKLKAAGARVLERSKEEQLAEQLLAEIQEQETSSREDASKYDNQIDELRLEIDQIREDISRSQREVSKRESRVRELNSLIDSRTSEIARLEERSNTLAVRVVESSKALESLQSEEALLQEKIAGLDNGGEEELSVLSEELRSLRDQQFAQDRIVREIRDKLVSAKSRKEALQAQLTAASPVTQLKKALGSNGVLSEELEGQCKLLLDGIRVPERYSKALQSVLAERSTFLVVDKISDAARSFQKMVLDADPNNKRGLGVGLFAKDAPLTEGLSKAVGTGEVVPLLSHLDVEPWSERVVSRLLNNVWVADTLDNAFSFVESLDYVDSDLLVVTEAGDLLSPWSFYSLRHDGGVVQMKSDIDRGNRLITECEAQYDKVSAERDDVVAQIEAKDARITELSRVVKENQHAMREFSNRQSEIRGRIKSEGRMYEQLTSDVEKIKPQQEELRGQIGRIQEEIDQVTAELAGLEDVDASAAEARLQELHLSLKGFEEKRRSLRDEFSALLRNLEARRRQRDSCRDAHVKERMSVERIRGELESAEQNLSERFGQDDAQSLREAAETRQELASEARRELESKVSAIRARLEREGEVDPSVIEQHEEERKRLEDLESQRSDLIEATTTLESTLIELSDACNKRFVATFDAIRANFATFGPKLFGGGSAELRLVDPTNPLESGVEIVVRPPGKKPKSIDLLSGGEKALCAIALVFSMFMVRPSPICVLDEVDAPLDEANVQRFIAFIKEMSEKTQFLMITHNKASMAAADTLVGVTMPQPGASKIITVSLQEAVQHVA
jgi:chromosome segregation protein